MPRTKPYRMPIYDALTRQYKIPLTKGFFAIVDQEDLETLAQFGKNWNANLAGSTNHARTHYYDGRTNSKGWRVQSSVYMHQFLAASWGWLVPEGYVLDHIDGNGLNNRRSNLRIVSQQQNVWNSGTRVTCTTGVKGVCVWRRKGRKPRYRARIMVDGKRILIGDYKTLEEAKAAYAAASIKYHGEFGRTSEGSNYRREPH